MNLLTPLYALAALAIAFPILFHLIRKRPKDRHVFSSLMFLEPSPPRLTHESRIDQWLLLLLRALALALIAAAFTRPYWNVAEETSATASGVRKMILVDVSASMNRKGAWEAANQRVRSMIDAASPTDVVSIYEFDRNIRPLLSIDAAVSTAPAQRRQAAQAGIQKAKLGWNSTDLGNALIEAADMLQTENDPDADTSSGQNEIVVVTDFQKGAKLERLANYSWPASCKVRIERVAPTESGNAHAIVLSTLPTVESTKPTTITSLNSVSRARNESEALSHTNRIRVRVTNQSDSKRESLSLCWLDANQQPIAGSETQCSVPAGTTRIVQMSAPKQLVSALKLLGDANDFDEPYFVATTQAAHSMLVCIDAAEQPAEQSLSYFLKQLPLDSPQRTVAFELRSPDSADAFPLPQLAPMIVASHHATAADLEKLAQYTRSGGQTLYVMDAPQSSNKPDYTDALIRLSGDAGARVEEATVRDYSMFEQIDFKHPLFVDLSDAKFNDFTKVRFWSHRRLDLGAKDDWQVVARFDDGSPALVHRQLGDGSLWILMAGWQPPQSQLALSSKFVPILTGLFRLSVPADSTAETLSVGDTIQISSDQKWSVQSTVASESTSSSRIEPTSDSKFTFDRPGIYQTTGTEPAQMRVVNLDPSESETAVGDLVRLEQLGVQMSDDRPEVRKQAMKRQMRAVELEAQQGWWRWLVVSVIGLVGIESLLCIRRSVGT